MWKDEVGMRVGCLMLMIIGEISKLCVDRVMADYRGNYENGRQRNQWLDSRNRFQKDDRRFNDRGYQFRNGGQKEDFSREDHKNRSSSENFSRGDRRQRGRLNVLKVSEVQSDQTQSADETKVRAIPEMKPTRNSKEVSEFLGMSQWYAKFIKNYADLCEPFYNLKRKLNKFCWSIETQKAFDAVKAAITKVTVLKFPDFKMPFELFKNASSIDVGAVPNQEQRPVVLVSRTLSCAERNYTVTERECLAVVWTLNKFRTYLGSLPMRESYYGSRCIDAFNKCERLSIRHVKTVVYRPQANRTERVNRDLVQMIANYVNNQHDTWDQFLREFAYAIRTAMNETAGKPPSELFLVRKLITPFLKLVMVSDGTEFAKEKPRARIEETITPNTGGYNLRPRSGRRVESRPDIEMKTQQGGPVRARKSKGRNYNPYIEEQARSGNKNTRRRAKKKILRCDQSAKPIVQQIFLRARFFSRFRFPRYRCSFLPWSGPVSSRPLVVLRNLREFVRASGFQRTLNSVSGKKST
ncbi:retrovirus-related Pol polyprotein from transposon opus [Trichonephila clavipes]|nr:retrovirus-related Pol polyprotein from transposon opus [Trichonephila clavipes]